MFLFLIHLYEIIYSFFYNKASSFRKWFFENKTSFFAIMTNNDEVVVIQDYENTNIFWVASFAYWWKLVSKPVLNISHPRVKFLIVTYYNDGQKYNKIIDEVKNDIETSSYIDINYAIINNTNITCYYADFEESLKTINVTANQFGNIINKRYNLRLQAPYIIEIADKEMNTHVFKDNDIIKITT